MAYDDFDRFLDEEPGPATPSALRAPAPAAPRAAQEPDDFDRFLDEPGPDQGVVLPSIKRTAGQMVESVGTTIEDITGPNVVTRGLQDFGGGVVRDNPSQIQSFGDVLDKPWTTVKEAVAEQVPQLGAAFLGARTGALAGGAVGGPWGAAGGALVGGLAPIFVQEYGEIRNKQEETGEENIPLALGGATAATALERLGVEKLATRAGARGFRDLVSQVPEGANRLVHAGKQLLKGGLIEGPATEIPQTVIERYAGGQEIDTPEAFDEYGVAGAKGFAGGGAVRGSLALVAPREQPQGGAPPPTPPSQGGGLPPPSPAPAGAAPPNAGPAQPPPNPPPSQGGGQEGAEDVGLADLDREQRRHLLDIDAHGALTGAAATGGLPASAATAQDPGTQRPPSGRSRGQLSPLGAEQAELARADIAAEPGGQEPGFGEVQDEQARMAELASRGPLGRAAARGAESGSITFGAPPPPGGPPAGTGASPAGAQPPGSAPASGPGQALAEPDLVSAAAAPALGETPSARAPAAPPTQVPSAGLGKVSDIAFHQIGDLGFAGELTESHVPPSDWQALKDAGVVLTGTTEDGTPYEYVPAESLYPERERRYEAERAKARKGLTPEQKRAATEKRASFFDRLAQEQEDLGELGDLEKAREYRAKATEWRQRRAAASAQPDLVSAAAAPALGASESASATRRPTRKAANKGQEVDGVFSDMASGAAEKAHERVVQLVSEGKDVSFGNNPKTRELAIKAARASPDLNLRDNADGTVTAIGARDRSTGAWVGQAPPPTTTPTPSQETPANAGVSASGAGTDLLSATAAPALGHVDPGEGRKGEAGLAPTAGAPLTTGSTDVPSRGGGIIADSAVDQAADQAATSPNNDLPQPTEPQKQAGNYQKGHVRYAGLDISIENPRGSKRSGVDPKGKPWEVEMSAHYGYIRRTEGKDGEQVDVYLASEREDTSAFVVDQVDPDTREFDEHKVILGAATRDEAEAVYDRHFSDGSGPKRGQGITELSMDQFKAWLKDGKTDEPISGQPLDLAAPSAAPQGGTPPPSSPFARGRLGGGPRSATRAAKAQPPPSPPPQGRGGLADPRLRDDNTQRALRHMATQAGWAQRGGELLLDEKDKVIGRTQWLPNEPWYAGIPERLNREATIEAVRKAIAGEKLGAKERRVVGYMLDAYESEREYEEGRVSAEEPGGQEPGFGEGQDEPDAQGRRAFQEVQDEREVQLVRRQEEDEAEREAREEREAIMAEAELALDALPYDDIDALFAQGEARSLSNEGIDRFFGGETPEGGGRAEEADAPREVDGSAAPGAEARLGGDALLERYSAEDLAERDQAQLDAERKEADDTAAAETGSDLIADETSKLQRSAAENAPGGSGPGRLRPASMRPRPVAGAKISIAPATDIQPAAEARPIKQPSSTQPAEKAGDGSQATPASQQSDQANLPAQETPAPAGVSVSGKGKAPMPGVALAHALRDRVLAKPLDRITAMQLFAMATKAYGGTVAEGKYVSKDAYDALELGLNLARLRARPNVEGETAERARAILDQFEESQDRLPTPSKRSGEQVELQQFSTPHTHAHVMAWVANLGPSDIVLEPSAGTGNVIAQALLYGPKAVHANEISERRAELVSELGVPVSRENAAHIHALLPGFTPSVVLMNPPFSANVLMKGKKAVDTGAQHVEAALKKLARGGRLVALLGRGMGFTESGQPMPRFREWWGRIQNEYNVRAVYGIAGREYRKFGTEFDTALVVIDKTGPTIGPIAHGSVEKVRDLPALLEGIRNDRRTETRTATAEAGEVRGHRAAGEPPAREQGSEKGALGAERGEARSTSPVRLPVDRVVPAGAETADAERPGRYAGTGRGGDVALEAGERDPVSDRNSGTATGAVAPERPGNAPDGATGDRSDPDLRAARQDVGDRGGISDEGLRRDAISREVEGPSRSAQALDAAAVFEQYRPRIAIRGAKSHPAVLAESAAMASVKAPESTYLPSLPTRIIEEGRLSDAQLVNVIQAGQSHGELLPNGERRGYFIGDGTGVGKGAQIAGIILDNWNQGRKRAVWVSENGKLFNDAGRDIEWVGLDKGALQLHNRFKSEIPLQEGVLFTTYNTLKGGVGGEKDATGKVVTEPLKRLDQIVNWLGEDFDGVIAFDEAHNLGNSLDEKGDRGVKKAAGKALAGVELQKRLPKARVLYVSATGATSVENLAYTDRLGLWGEGTAFANKRDFIDKIKAGGVASMEVVAKDMKAMGLYEARNLAFAGVEQRELLHSLTPDQTEIYNEIARAWQLVLANVNAALKITGAEKSARAKSNALSQFWGSQQRFFNQVLTSLSVPTLIRETEAQLKAGHSAVMQLVNTNEAVQDRRLAQAAEQEIDIGDIDINPRDVLMQYVQNAFPTQLYATTLDEEGNEKSEPVKDSLGNPVEDPEAVRRRGQLLEKLASLAVPEGVLEQVINHFGTQQVAEITGRSRRVLRHKDGSTEIESLSPSKSNKDADAFMQGKKRILIFSDAGGTGRSYHADLKAKNQQKRIHFLVQPGWRADKAVQGLGRTHRTNQKHPPEYVLVTTNLKAQRRFMSSIARRLDQLGALTKGQRDTASQGLFSAEMNLENQYGQWALRSLMADMLGGRVPGITKQTLEQEMGLYLTDPKTGAIQENNMPTVPRFLNRMLALESETMDRVFDAFYERLEAGIDYARQQGTLDVGMETITAQSVEKLTDQVIAGGQGKAETRYVKLALTDPVRFVQFDQLPWTYKPAIARNRKSGKLYAFVEAPTLTDPETGQLVQRLRRLGVRDQKYLPKRELDGDAYEMLADRPREELRAAWDAEIAKSPQTKTSEMHLVTGALLPVWDRLPTDTPKVLRTETDEGERLLGREILPSDLNATLKALGAQGERPALSPVQMVRSIMEDGATLTLANGWRIGKRTVSGEERIEVMGATGGDIAILKDQGGFTEIIAFKNRVFVPTGTAPEIIERITKSKPVVEVDYARGARGDSGVRYSRGTGAGYSRGAEATALTPRDDDVTVALKLLAENDELFQLPRSDRKSLSAIAKDVTEQLKAMARDILPDMTVEDLGSRFLSPEDEYAGWWQIKMPDGQTADVYQSKDGYVHINASDLKSGQSRGSALYHLVANFAFNNGLVFRGDPLGISEDAKFRRTENMLSSALKFGTTRHLQPHPDQGVAWQKGDDGFNIASLARKSVANIKEVFPAIDSIEYNFETRRFEAEHTAVDTGRREVDVVEGAYFKVAAYSARGTRSARAGGATFARAALVNTLLRRSGQEGWDGVLAQITGERGPRGLSEALRRVFYSKVEPPAAGRPRGAPLPTDQKPGPAGLSVSGLRETLVARFGAGVRRLIKAKTLRIVQHESELPEYLNDGKGGIRGAYDIEGEADVTWLVADNLTAADAPGVFLHEIGVHYGLERMIGAEKYHDIIAQVKRMEADGNPAALAARAAIPKGTHGGVVDDELVAYLVEKHPELPIVKRIIAAIRAFLFKHGLIKNIRPEDVVALAKAAARHAARTPSYLPLRKGEGGVGVAPAYSGSPLWYSEMARFLDDKAPGKAPAGQWKMLLANWAKQGKFKGDELEWSGVKEWLDLQQGAVTKVQVLDFVREDGVRVEEKERGGVEYGGLPPKFANYQLPGGENYRELPLRLPDTREANARKVADAAARSWEEGLAAVQRYGITHEEAYKIINRQGFRSSHFDEPNILAHVRFNERTDAEGKRVLFVEEIQSDWAQQGKKGGFGLEVDDEGPMVEIGGAEIMNGVRRVPGVPRGPFVGKTEAWVALALKRMIRHAAENGFDRIAWTNGEQQAERHVEDLVGKDLKVGGEGMRAFYDKIVPNVANGLLKKLGGGRVSEVELTKPFDLTRGLDYKGGETTAQPGFTITPELRASAMRGLPLFSRQDEPNGQEPGFYEVQDEQGRLQLVRQAMAEIAAGKSESVARGLRADLSQYGGDADVHFPWGDLKHGIYHIGNQRGLDVLGRVLRAVAIGAQVQYVPAKKTVRITHEGMVAVLSLDEHGKRKTWLLTGWEEGKPDARGEVGTRTAATQPGPTFSRTDLGAGFLDNIAAGGGSVKGPQAPLYSRATPPPAPPSQGGERGAPPDPDTPEGSAEALGRIGEAMRSTRHGWDAIKSKVLEDWRPAWLGLFTRRQLVDIGQGMVPELATYDRAVQAMDADRNIFDDQAHDVAEAAAAYVRANKKEADQLFDLMHAATLAGVDPADRFRPSINRNDAFAEMSSLRRRMRTRPGEADVLQARIDEIMTRLSNEKVRKKAHPGLARRYWGLTQDAKVVYAKMRDLYKKRFDEREDALIQRIRDAEADERWKARLIADIKHRFETARLSAPYFPLTRFGDYWVAAVNPHGEKEYHLRESSHQQKSLIEELQRGGYHEIAHGFKLDSLFEQQGASAGFVSDVIKLLDKGMRNSPGAADLKDSIYQMYLQSLPELSARKHWIHRQKTPGFSKDALRGFAKQMFHGNRQLARLRHQTAMEKALTAARKSVRDADQPNRAAQLVNEMQKREEWIKNPTTSTWANVAGSIGFLWYLTAPASAIVNVTQTPLVAYPILATRHGWGAAAKALTGATRDYFRGRFTVEGALQGEELAAYRRFLADGVIDKTQSHDLAGMSETPSAIYSGRAAKFMRASSFLFHRAERMNREVTALAAYRLARAQGLGVDAAYEQAKALTWESHFDYSNSNKARFIQGDVPRVLFMFKQFSQHMTYLLARSAHQSLKGLSPTARRDARLRLTGLLGMHALFAGALGMPLMGTLAMVMNSLFDDEDEPYDFDLEFRNFLADAFGPEIGQAIARGPVESLTELGIAKRVGLSDLWFRDRDKTLEGRGVVEHWAETLLGPLGGIAFKAGTGYEMFQDGHTVRALESMTPTAIRSGLQMLRYADEGAQSLRGDPVMEDISTWNLLGQAAGFSPAELGQRYDANRALKDLEQRITVRRERLINRWWLARRTGDLEGVQEAMAEIARFNGSSNIRENPRARITPATLLASTQARRNYSRRAEGGIIVDRRLSRLEERVRFAP